MKLTGKCLDVFGDRYFEYENLPESCQNALIIDFFDSVGIYVTILPCIDETFDSYVTIKEKRIEACQFQENRTKATNAAITKANEIYNMLKKC